MNTINYKKLNDYQIKHQNWNIFKEEYSKPLFFFLCDSFQLEEFLTIPTWDFLKSKEDKNKDFSDFLSQTLIENIKDYEEKRKTSVLIKNFLRRYYELLKKLPQLNDYKNSEGDKEASTQDFSYFIRYENDNNEWYKSYEEYLINSVHYTKDDTHKLKLLDGIIRYFEYKVKKIDSEKKVTNGAVKFKKVHFNLRLLQEQMTKKPLQQIISPSSKVKLPYQIALLNELGFFELDKFKNLSQSKVYQITAKLLNADKRGVSGNHRVLDPKSNEDRFRYTSDKHIDDVKKYLDRL